MLNRLKFAFISLMAVGLLFCVSNAASAYDRGGEWPPTETGTVIVQVTAMGSPIEHADVSVGDSSDSTGHNGNRVFQVENGFHTVSVTDSHGNTDSKEVRVDPGTIIQVTFELGAAGRPASEGGH
ncbi:MAG: hypothetical protein GY777_03155 [Candidatus Brocadiaceae bacterium]|nr:hypothetical protein [Candidatus Brocadiaceae bacterium]